MLILFFTLFLSLNLQAGQHGPMDPPVVPAHLLRNPRAQARKDIRELQKLMRLCEQQKTRMVNNPLGTETLERRMAEYRKDIERLNDQESQLSAREMLAILTVSILFGITMHVYRASQASQAKSR
jgi:phage shock protein A